jgi:hypothetical protein
MTYEIIYNNNVVTITLGNRRFENNISDYLTIRNLEYLDKCCDLFLHLSEKDIIIEKELYFELAILIKNEAPQNSINWVNTFIAIEKENYAEVLRSKDDDESEISVFDNIEKAIHYNDEIQSEMSSSEIRKAMREGVENELKRREII